MKRNSLAWILIGGSMFTFASIQLAACSDSNSGNGLPSGNGSDATAKKDGEEEGDGSSGTDGGKKDGSTGGDAAQECGTPPQLRPRAHMDAGNGADGGPFMNFFCPFSSPPGQSAKYCNSGSQSCCIPFGTGNQSTCENGGCPNEADGGPFDGREIVCTDPIDCPGQVCCGIGQILEDPECGTRFGKGFRGTKCAASCDENNGEFELCQKQEHCASGTCTPASAAGVQFGTCVQ